LSQKNNIFYFNNIRVNILTFGAMFLDTLKERYDELGQTTKVIMAVITVLIVFMVATFVGIDTMLGKSEAQVRLYSTDATTAADVAKAVVADARREAVSQQDELRKAIDRVN
jgi:NAD-dependent SIR2 family protein deacetylase